MQFLKNVIRPALSFLTLFAIGCERPLDDNTIFHTVIDVEPDISPFAGSVFIGEAEARFGTDSYDLGQASCL